MCFDHLFGHLLSMNYNRTVVALIDGTCHPLDAAKAFQVTADGGGEAAGAGQRLHIGVGVGTVANRGGAVAEAKGLDPLLGISK